MTEAAISDGELALLIKGFEGLLALRDREDDAILSALRELRERRSAVETSTVQPVAQRLYIEGSDSSNEGWYEYDEVDPQLGHRLKDGWEPLYAGPAVKASEPLRCHECGNTYNLVMGCACGATPRPAVNGSVKP